MTDSAHGARPLEHGCAVPERVERAGAALGPGAAARASPSSRCPAGHPGRRAASARLRPRRGDGAGRARPRRVPRAERRVPVGDPRRPPARQSRLRPGEQRDADRRRRGRARGTSGPCGCFAATGPRRPRRAAGYGSAAEPSEEALDELRERLVDLVFLGLPEAVPLSARGHEPADRDRLLAQAAAIEQEAAAPPRKGRRCGRSAGGARGRVRPRLPRAAARPSRKRGRDRKALRRSDELLGGDPLRALSWLQGVSRVRPGASRLVARSATRPRSTRKAALDLKVAQLPFVAGRALGRACAHRGAELPPGKLSLVVHLPRAVSRGRSRLPGLVIDEWVETVPAAEVTTGVAFNFDAPGARPPQGVLLAVAPPGAAPVGARHAREDPAGDARARAAARRRPAGARRRRAAPARAAGARTSPPTSRARRSRPTSRGW